MGEKSISCACPETNIPQNKRMSIENLKEMEDCMSYICEMFLMGLGCLILAVIVGVVLYDIVKTSLRR